MFGVRQYGGLPRRSPCHGVCVCVCACAYAGLFVCSWMLVCVRVSGSESMSRCARASVYAGTRDAACACVRRYTPAGPRSGTLSNFKLVLW